MVTILNIRIKEQRLKNNLTLLEVANRLGIKEATMQRYESGVIKNISHETILKLSQIFGCTPSYLMGWDDEEPSHSPNITDDTIVFPVIGELAAGYDMFANEEYDALDSIEIPSAYLQGRPKDDFFVLKIHGNSMYPLYMNNDKVLIKKTPTLNRSGDIGVVQYEDYATLKKVEYVDGEDWMKLIPINPSYEPKTISGSELEQCRIVGVPVLLIREIEQ